MFLAALFIIRKKLEGREMSGLGKSQPISSLDSYHTATEKSPYEDNVASWQTPVSKNDVYRPWPELCKLFFAKDGHEVWKNYNRSFIKMVGFWMIFLKWSLFVELITSTFKHNTGQIPTSGMQAAAASFRNHPSPSLASPPTTTGCGLAGCPHSFWGLTVLSTQ